MFQLHSDSRRCPNIPCDRLHDSYVNIGFFARVVPAGRYLAGAMLFLALPLFLLSCSNKSDEEHSSACNLSRCQAFCDSVVSLSSIPLESLPGIILRWKDMESGIFETWASDSLCLGEELSAVSCLASMDSLLMECAHHCIDEHRRSFIELSTFQCEVSMAQFPPQNSFIREANSFYQLNLCQSAVMDSPQQTLDRYAGFMEEVAEFPFSDFDDIQEMLYQEDLLYRAYMDDLMSHSFRDSYAIILQTEDFSDRLADYAVSHPSETERLLAYMTVRTIRRQLLCAQKGLSSILNDEVRTQDQATSAVTSFTALFLHFNPLLMVYRTETQQEEVEDIGLQIPDALLLLESKGLRVFNNADSLANYMLKDYVDYLFFK